MTRTTTPDLLTAAEVADILRVSPRQVAEEVRYRAGFPKPFKPGRILLWDREEVLHWLQLQRVD